MEDGMKIVSDRWMLQSRQIVNWGSYGGYPPVPPAPEPQMAATTCSARPWTMRCR